MKRCLPEGNICYSSDRRPRRLKTFSLFLFFLSLVFFSFDGHAQDRITVTGKVISGDSAIVGATVQVKGHREAVQTGREGLFSISAPSGAVLVISYVGYSPEEVRAA